MIVEQDEGAVKITCMCGADGCGDPAGPGLVVEVFEGQDTVIMLLVTNDGAADEEIAVSLRELRRVLDGHTS